MVPCPNMAAPSVTSWLRGGWATPGKVCEGWRMEGLGEPCPLQKFCIYIVLAQGCHNEYHRPGGLNYKRLYLTALEAGSLRSGWQHGWVLVRAFLDCRQLPPCCVFTWWIEILCPLLTEINSIMRAPPARDPNDLSKAPSPNTILPHRELGLQHTNLGGHIQSIVCMYI